MLACAHCGGKPFVQCDCKCPRCNLPGINPQKWRRGVDPDWNCESCSNERKTYCIPCQATGKIEKQFIVKFQVRCEVCAGTGFLPCRKCGERFNALHPDTRCTVCQGTALNPSCPTCMGTGRRACPWCNGKSQESLSTMMANLSITRNHYDFGDIDDEWRQHEMEHPAVVLDREGVQRAVGLVGTHFGLKISYFRLDSDSLYVTGRGEGDAYIYRVEDEGWTVIHCNKFNHKTDIGLELSIDRGPNNHQ